jgi:CheY-like chemotaxis protein
MKKESPLIKNQNENKKKFRVLLAEDEAFCRINLCACLDVCGFEHLAVEDGQLATEALLK